MQVIRDWLGLGIGLGVGEFGGWLLAGAVADGVLPGGPELPPAGLVLLRDGVGEAERLAVADCAGPRVKDMPVPSDESADWLLPGGDETAGRIVVAAPLVNVGPLPDSSVYPVTPSATAATPPMIAERRRLLPVLPREPPRARRSRRSRRREGGCPGAPGGSGSHTALIAGP